MKRFQEINKIKNSGEPGATYLGQPAKEVFNYSPELHKESMSKLKNVKNNN
jgi:hypothetical protein